MEARRAAQHRRRTFRRAAGLDRGRDVHAGPARETAAALLGDYRALFGAVADTVLRHRLLKGDRLPTRKTGFEYALGPGVAGIASAPALHYLDTGLLRATAIMGSARIG